MVKMIRLLIPACMALGLTACLEDPPSFNTDELFPTIDPELRCTVVINNPGQSISGPETSLSNIQRTGSGNDDELVRPYYLGGHCLTGEQAGFQWGFPDEAIAVADWRRFYPRHLQQLADDPALTTLIGLFPNGWCEVAGSATCVPTGGSVGVCMKLEPLTDEDTPLPTCAPPPAQPELPEGPCLEIACGSGDATCNLVDNGNLPETQVEIAFGSVPLGEARVHPLELSNCGEDGDPAVELTADGTIYANSAYYDFLIQIPGDPTNPQAGENSCYPPDIANSSVRVLAPGDPACTIPVIFFPTVWGGHTARTILTSNARPDISVQFSAFAQPGSLSFEVDGAPYDPPQGGAVCVEDRVQGNCTRVVTVRATNNGPGAVSVDLAEFVPSDQRFQFVNAPAADDVVPPGDTRDFDFQWCGPPNQRGDAELLITFDDIDPDRTPFQLSVTREDVTGTCP